MTQENQKYVSFYYENMGGSQEISIDPEKAALLIVDMQNEFVHKEYGEALDFKRRGEWDRWAPYFDRLHKVVIPNTKKLLKYFRDNNLQVTYGRISCLKKDGSDRCLVQKKPGWNGMLIPINSFGAQMVEDLQPMEDEIVVNKTTDSVVAGTNYATLIRNIGIETVVVTGIVTDQCVSSTVRGLADEGFNVIVVEDCCAAATKELHDHELEIINIIYCNVMSTEETINLLEESKRELHISSVY